MNYGYYGYHDGSKPTKGLDYMLLDEHLQELVDKNLKLFIKEMNLQMKEVSSKYVSDFKKIKRYIEELKVSTKELNKRIDTFKTMTVEEAGRVGEKLKDFNYNMSFCLETLDEINRVLLSNFGVNVIKIKEAEPLKEIKEDNNVGLSTGRKGKKQSYIKKNRGVVL